jgi:hypothetical protein
VPRPGDPQSLNRYSYVSNNPLSRIDPDGHSDQDTWYWQNRYYNARGQFWDGNGWNNKSHAFFADDDILNETLHEAGVYFENGDKQWTFREKSVVGQGVVALSDKVGGLSKLRGLLGGNGWTELSRSKAGTGGCATGHACTGGVVERYTGFGANHIEFYDGAFSTPQYSRWAAVHELGHAIDNRQRTPDGRLLSDAFASGNSISFYGQESSREQFSEAVADWVYGLRDGRTDVRHGPGSTAAARTKAELPERSSLTVDQATWLGGQLLK